MYLYDILLLWHRFCFTNVFCNIIFCRGLLLHANICVPPWHGLEHSIAYRYQSRKSCSLDWSAGCTLLVLPTTPANTVGGKREISNDPIRYFSPEGIEGAWRADYTVLDRKKLLSMSHARKYGLWLLLQVIEPVFQCNWYQSRPEGSRDPHRIVLWSITSRL